MKDQLSIGSSIGSLLASTLGLSGPELDSCPEVGFSLSTNTTPVYPLKGQCTYIEIAFVEVLHVYNSGTCR